MKPSTDTVPAMLTPGEFVIRKDAAEEIGPEKLHMLNNIDRLGQSALLENAKSPMGYQEGGEAGQFQAQQRPSRKKGREYDPFKEVAEDMWKKINEPSTAGPSGFGGYDDVVKPGDFDFVGPLSQQQEQKLHILKLLDELGGAPKLKLRGYQEGGKVKLSDYWKTGRSYTREESDAAYREYFGDKYGGGETGLEFAEKYEYKPNPIERLLDKLPGIGGKRAFGRAKDYSERVFSDPESLERREDEREREIDVYGKILQDYVSENDKSVKDMFMMASLQQATEDPRNFGYSMHASDMDKSKINQYIQGSDVGHQTHDRGGRYRSVDEHNITQTKRGKDLFGIIPWGYEGSVKENPGINPMLDVQKLKEQIDNMKTAQFIPGYQEGGPVMHNKGQGQTNEVLSLFGEKSQDADGLQKLAALATMQRALDIQKAIGAHGEGMATHTMPDGTVMPGATHEEYEAMGMRGGGYVPQYQEGGSVEPPMPTGEQGPQQAPMSSGQQAYYKPPMEQLGMDEFEYSSYIKYGPDMYKYFPQNFKPKEQWTAYDSLVSDGIIDPYKVSKDSINVLTDDQLNELLGQRKPPQ